MNSRLILVIGLLGAGLAQAGTGIRMVATAFTMRGLTKTGTPVHRGIAAADPAVLPIGSRIRVQRAGAYSGIYIVTDTGPAVRGRTLDLFIPSAAAAKKFGRRFVTVQLLHKPRRPRHVKVATR